GVHWIEPRLVAEVEFSSWTDDGRLRHPSFQGLRDDKAPHSIGKELPQPMSTPAKHNGAAASGPKTAPLKKKGDTQFAGVVLSNPDRVLYPEQQITKRDLAAYYSAVAEWALPHMVGRPLAIVRCPRG